MGEALITRRGGNSFKIVAVNYISSTTLSIEGIATAKNAIIFVDASGECNNYTSGGFKKTVLTITILDGIVTNLMAQTSTYKLTKVAEPSQVTIDPSDLIVLEDSTSGYTFNGEDESMTYSCIIWD